MCGIVAYVGDQAAVPYLLEGLRRLEYRGYDSAGIATLTPDCVFHLRKVVGRISLLDNLVARSPADGTIGIGHTRWATHGPPSEANAHPHVGGERVVLAHNGVIENYLELKNKLITAGYAFQSATDTEVIAHLIDQSLTNYLQAHEIVPEEPFAHLVAALREATAQLKGSFALVVLFRDYANVVLAARQGSPLVIGVGEGEHFVASDASPLVGYTDKIVYLADRQVAVVTSDWLHISDRDAEIVEHSVCDLQVDTGSVDLGTFKHYMLKEIYEQPAALRKALQGRLCEDDATAMFSDLRLSPRQLQRINRIVLTACGTSFHSALVGEYLLEEFARIPVEVEYASELRYRNPPLDQGTLLFAMSQSGETADTLAALREMKRKGHATIAVCNVPGSSLAHEADGTIFLNAGPEIGVASTKAYTSQVMTLSLLALFFGRMRHLSQEAGEKLTASLRRIPTVIEQALGTDHEVRRIAEKYAHCTNFLYLGRQYNFPTALEGALKLKEISYIHAEGYPAAEMKHGPIALVDQHTPSVFILPKGFVYDKVLSNVQEIKARGGPVIAVAEEGDRQIGALADDVIYVPQIDEHFTPLVSIVPLQLLAYHIAVLRGCDVDKPRNLAKSVTVE